MRRLPDILPVCLQDFLWRCQPALWKRNEQIEMETHRRPYKDGEVVYTDSRLQLEGKKELDSQYDSSISTERIQHRDWHLSAQCMLLMTWRMRSLRFMSMQLPEQILTLMKEKHFSEESIRETISEVEELKSNGQLFTEDAYDELSIDLKKRKNACEGALSQCCTYLQSVMRLLLRQPREYNGDRAIMSLERLDKELSIICWSIRPSPKPWHWLLRRGTAYRLGKSSNRL